MLLFMRNLVKDFTMTLLNFQTIKKALSTLMLNVLLLNMKKRGFKSNLVTNPAPQKLSQS